MLRTVVALVFAGLAVLVAILQVGGLISARRRHRNYSLVPLIGAILGVAACLIAPWKHTAYAIPIFLLLDPTPVFLVLAVITGRFSK
jgi:hypothetical protein